MEGSDKDEKGNTTPDLKVEDEPPPGQMEIEAFLSVVSPEATRYCRAAPQNVCTNRFQISSGSKREPITQARRDEGFPATHATPAAQGLDPAMRRTESSDVAVLREAFESNDEGFIVPVKDEPQVLQPRVAQAQAPVDAVQNHAAPPQDSLSEPSAKGEEKDKPLYEFTKTDLHRMRQALLEASVGEIPEYALNKPNVGCVIHRPERKDAPEVTVAACNSFLPNIDKAMLKRGAAMTKKEQNALTSECCAHAETNALQKWPTHNLEDATVYVTHVPCASCTMQLLVKGVKRVFYLFWIKNSESSIRSFKTSNTSCIPFSRESRNNVLQIFNNSFLDDHNIRNGGTEEDIPKTQSFHLSEEDLKRGTSSDIKRSMLGDKVDKILQEFHEFRNQHSIKIVGVPEKNSKETALETSTLCVSLFSAMGAEVTLQDIAMAQRTAEGRYSDGPRPIICKFIRQLAKDSVMSVQQQACNVNPVKIGCSVFNIRICDGDEDSQEMTEGASSTQ